MSVSSPKSPKVCTRTQTLRVLSQPTREEVRQYNYERRQIQLANEGHFTPLGHAYHEVGGPIYLTARRLVQGTLGTVPKKIDMLNAYQTIEELTGYDPADSDNVEPPIPEIETLQLSSTFVEKALYSVRHHGEKSSPRSDKGDDIENKTHLKYMERRRKLGGVNLKQVLKESNASTTKVKRGKRMFLMLSDELCNKVNEFWEKRDYYERRRRTDILPPQRKYMDLTIRGPPDESPVSKTKTPKQMAADRALYEELIKVERQLEEDALKEDKLLSREAEIAQLTQQIYETAPSLLDTIAVVKSDHLASTSALVSEGSKAPVFTLAVERRRRRLMNQWVEEQPRPFEPKYINVCRPNISAELETGQKKAEPVELKADNHLELADASADPELQTTGESEDQTVPGGTSLRRFFFQEMLYAQLCCLIWLLEQMICVERGKGIGSSVISTSWNWKTSSTLKSTAMGEISENIERAWRQFVLHQDPLAKPKRRWPSVSGLKWGSRPSSRTSSVWQPISSKRSVQESGRTSVCNTQRSLDNVRSLVGVSHQWNQQNKRRQASGSSSSRVTPDSSAARTTSSSDDKTASSSQSPSALSGRNVKFTENVELLDLDEREEEEVHPLANRKWITLHELREKLPRDVISDMAFKIANELEEEENKENPKKSRDLGQVIISADDLDPEKLAGLNYSEKWKNLPSTMRKRLEDLKEQRALEFQDRVEYQRQLRAKVCLAKYQTIPSNTPVHLAIRTIQRQAPYADALAVLAKQKAAYKELAPWYVDLLDELDKLQADTKINSAVKRLEHYAQLPSGQFTVLQFTHVLQSLELWELCLPMVSAAADFIRSRILDMTLEEYVDWLHQTYPGLKNLDY